MTLTSTNYDCVGKERGVNNISELVVNVHDAVRDLHWRPRACHFD